MGASDWGWLPSSLPG